ncbi:hypothetical protein, partial [Xenorhabdus bovienii]|uniref:hypothetical protein n=1 Tax=Xenorhabdus bovienii TaxID=40576 RepID=UPI002157D34E
DLRSKSTKRAANHMIFKSGMRCGMTGIYVYLMNVMILFFILGVFLKYVIPNPEIMKLNRRNHMNIR